MRLSAAKQRLGADAAEPGSRSWPGAVQPQTHYEFEVRTPVVLYVMQNTPSVDRYIEGLSAIGAHVTEQHRSVLSAQYHAPRRTATAGQLAAWAGIGGGHPVVNRLYGGLGHLLCEYLGINPDLRPDDPHRWWSVWSRGWSTPEGFVWEMLPQVAEALERLDWVKAALLPEEAEASAALVSEGAVFRVAVNMYERSPQARRRCIEAHGSACCVCGFDFGATYGSVAEGYIHIHHLRPLAQLGGVQAIDPVAELRPVCPNCHAVLHQRSPPYSIDEVVTFLRQRHRA